jgi:hypothetical protein
LANSWSSSTKILLGAKNQTVLNDLESSLGESYREFQGASGRSCRCRRQNALDLFHEFDSFLGAAAFVVQG